MAKSKYAQALEGEQIFKKYKPKVKVHIKPIKKEEHKETPHYEQRKKPEDYFGRILSSDFEDIELEIRGLRLVKEFNDRTGKEEIVYKRRKEHYLSEEGAEDLLLELKGHLSSDIKLGILTQDEFLKTQDIIRKGLVSYISNNLYQLGMDTEAKQRKAPTLIIMLLNRIRSVYSQSILGKTHERSHGEVRVSGDLGFGDKRHDDFDFDRPNVDHNKGVRR